MAKKEIKLVVCGQGRCGSSMVMTMLKAGGLRVPGEPPRYEPDEEGQKRAKRDIAGFMVDYDAIKWLHPSGRNVKPGRMPDIHEWRFLFIRRNLDEQIKSWLRFQRHFEPGKVPDLPDADLLSRGRKALAEAEAKSLQIVRGTSYTHVPILRYEWVLEDPLRAAKRIARWSGMSLDYVAMAEVVEDRSPKCAGDVAK